MKVAILAPSPVPFMIGGAENLARGLYDELNANTEHQAELIKLPSREFSFWELIENYYQFYTLDLNHFDAVIVSKYPAWMIRHKNSVCYMLHCLRGLYDTYHLTGLEEEVKRGNYRIDTILGFMDRYKRPADLDVFFRMLFELKADCAHVPPEYFNFPGPFIRALVHYMDRFGLSQGGNRPLFAISETVKRRAGYFPKNADVRAVYPPAHQKTFARGAYRHLFMVSRLDEAKRIDMLIRAMRRVKSDIKLYIAGTGPQEEALKRLAEGDARIEFLGFVNDDEVESYYAGSLVIPYFPYDEDYGLITIEAMMHYKPVITTKDAGGPTEFVTDGETGFVTAFEEKAIAEKIDFFAANPEEARRMGQNAYERVKGITWASTVSALMDEAQKRCWPVSAKGFAPAVKGQKRRKLTVVSSYPIYPPTGGGQSRAYHLYREAAKRYDVEIVSFDGVGAAPTRMLIAPGLMETRVPKRLRHQELEDEMSLAVKLPATDIAMITLSGETPEYGEALKRALSDSEYFVASHPYLYPEAQKYLSGQAIVYEAQDIEYTLKKDMLPDTALARELIERVREAEARCCGDSALILTCSGEDREAISELYGAPKEKIIVVPNGVDTGATAFVPPAERMQNKRECGLEHEAIVLFMGSWHGPNLDACEEIFKIAALCPGIRFILMGSQCGYFEGKELPKNVGLLGMVSEDEKHRVFSVADCAINPMLSGSGTNLKMFDYMSAGIPILSSRVGTRGIGRKEVFYIAEPAEEMARALLKLLTADTTDMVCEARRYAEERFDWSVIAQTLINGLEALER